MYDPSKTKNNLVRPEEIYSARKQKFMTANKWIFLIGLAMLITGLILKAHNDKPKESGAIPIMIETAHAEEPLTPAEEKKLCSLAAVHCPDEQPVEQQIRNISSGSGVDPDFLISLAMCESTLSPEAISAGGRFHGLYQWAKDTLDPVCAHDVVCSTQYTIEAINRGELWRWPNCPK